VHCEHTSGEELKCVAVLVLIGMMLPFANEPHRKSHVREYGVKAASNSGRLAEIAAQEGRKTKPGINLGVCGEHGGDPESIHFFHRTGLDYVSCSPFRLPVARLEAGRAAVSQRSSVGSLRQQMLRRYDKGLSGDSLAPGHNGVIDLAGAVSLDAAHDFGFAPPRVCSRLPSGRIAAQSSLRQSSPSNFN
jgi:hypothetical protein